MNKVGETAHYKRLGKTLNVARRHNAPHLDGADLLVLGLKKMPLRLSQEELGKLVGLSRNSVSRIERGGATDSYTFNRLMWFVTPDSPKKGPRP